MSTCVYMAKKILIVLGVLLIAIGGAVTYLVLVEPPKQTSVGFEIGVIDENGNEIPLGQIYAETLPAEQTFLIAFAAFSTGEGAGGGVSSSSSVKVFKGTKDISSYTSFYWKPVVHWRVTPKSAKPLVTLNPTYTKATCSEAGVTKRLSKAKSFTISDGATTTLTEIKITEPISDIKAKGVGKHTYRVSATVKGGAQWNGKSDTFTITGGITTDFEVKADESLEVSGYITWVTSEIVPLSTETFSFAELDKAQLLSFGIIMMIAGVLFIVLAQIPSALTRICRV